ncbi:MAG: hypothetical protein KDA84_05020 [Planctomycetaceae bacterium]|nr:hypothetical protein [Planctomycetaceae bacterium]
MSLIPRLLPTSLAVFCLLGLVGCGGSEEFPTTPVSGKVTHNGQPVKGGSVTLMPVAKAEGKSAGKPATGSVGDDGTFTLTTYKDKDGAVVGKHRVSYSPPAAEVKENPSGGHSQAPKSPYVGLKPKQEEVDITESTNEITIELTK